MTAPRRPVRKTGLRVRAYDVLTRAVEEGVAAGYAHAHKYVRRPTEDVLKERIYDAVMNAIAEVFDFDPEPQDMV